VDLHLEPLNLVFCV